MEKILSPLRLNGIGIIITFHSLEHKIVARTLREMKKQEKVKLLEMGLQPSEEEIKLNSKSKSAQLYCFKKIEV